MKKILFLTLALVLTGYSLNSYAQRLDEWITGHVMDKSSGAAIPNVDVVLKGTIIGTKTDTEGNYKIFIPSNAVNPTLVFVIPGYIPQEQLIGDQEEINVSLEPTII